MAAATETTSWAEEDANELEKNTKTSLIIDFTPFVKNQLSTFLENVKGKIEAVGGRFRRNNIRELKIYEVTNIDLENMNPNQTQNTNTNISHNSDM